MNREQRRKAGKGLSNDKIDVAGLTVHFANGQYLGLDVNKVMVIDRDTKRPLFEEVLEPVPKQLENNAPDKPSQEFTEDDKLNYTVEFDTPEGRMMYVKKGNWAGIKKA